MNNLSITPQIRTLKSLVDEVRKGTICVPPFQRDFVWTREQIRDLFQSIQRNYPIGSILLWKPKENYDWTPNYAIGRYLLDKEDVGNTYILDGYQRLSSIFSCLTNPNTTTLPQSSEVDGTIFDLYYDLSDESFVYLRSASSRLPHQVPMYVFMSTSEFRKYSRAYIEPEVDGSLIDLYLDRADELSRKLVDYQLACVEIKGADMQEAVDIFSRLNSKGVEISMDWMVNALSYSSDFRFADEMSSLIAAIENRNFGTMKRDMLFRCYQSAFGKIYFDQREIDKLAKKPEFATKIRKTTDNILRAIDFLQTSIKMPSCQFIPYGTQLIFLMEFFEHYPYAIEDELAAIEKWFWSTTYSNYFTISSLSEQRKAYEHFIKCVTRGNLSELFYPSSKNVRYEALPLPGKIQLGSVRCEAVCLFMESHMNIIREKNVRRTSAFYDEKLKYYRKQIAAEEKKFVEGLGLVYKD